MLGFEGSAFGVLSPAKDFFGDCGLSFGESTFGQRSLELLDDCLEA
jgi:hypothetical protein